MLDRSAMPKFAALLIAFALSLLVLGGGRVDAQGDAGAEILWDAWGVPHIYAESENDLLYAWGWAQMRAHGDLILEQVAVARGEAAALWGEAYLESDRYVWTMGLPALTEAPAASASDTDSAFIDGMNAWAAANPGAIDPERARALPLQPSDVAALAFYDEFFNGLVVTPASIAELTDAWLAGESVRDPRVESGEIGSNAWAIAPQRTVDGNAILLANPHAPWPTLAEARHLLFFETHLVAPGIDVYGAGVIGLPALTFAFNRHLGWTATSAPTFDYLDLYELQLAEGGYRFDDAVLPFETQTVTLRVREPDGGVREEPLTLRRSVHGPVLAERGERALAVAFPLPDAGEVEAPQFWAMMEADALDAWLPALAPQNIFALNLLYADVDGNIAYALSGIFPDRPERGADGEPLDWGGVLPGDTSATLWRGKLPFATMPQLVNPASGVLQSANEPPHYAAGPEPLAFPGAPADWPGPNAWPRTRRSLALLGGQETFTPDDVMRLKFDSRSDLADRVLDTVIAVGRQFGSPEAQQAAEVLTAWDRRFEADSSGAVLFAFWAMHYQPDILGGARFPDDAFAEPFDPARPLDTPAGLADPGRAVEALEFASRAVVQTFGDLRVPWGAFYGFRLGDLALPGFGAPPEAFGVFQPNFAAPTPEGPLATVAGDTWIAVVEFADPVRAWALLPYGNASQPGNPHVADQLERYAGQTFREVWLERSDVEQNLELREQVGPR